MAEMVKISEKDVVIFAKKEDHATPSTIVLPKPNPPVGLILPNGEIDWNCPCLGGMVTGPCGVEFREAFTCFHYSQDEPKGRNCYDMFKSMQTCMRNYPTLYDNDLSEDNDLAEAMEQSGKESKGAAAESVKGVGSKQ